MASSTVQDIVQEIRLGFAGLLSRTRELAKAEVVPSARHAGVGGGFFAGAAVFALHALWMLVIAIALAIAWLLDHFTDLSPWGAGTLAFLITVVISLLVAGVLALIGRSHIKKVKKPEATIEETKASLAAITDAVTGKRPSLGIVVPDGGATVAPPARH